MFDNKKYFNISNNYTSGTKTVYEYRAPTDDSIRLAQEYYDKALNNIILNENIKGNSLDYNVLIYKNYDYKTIMTITLLINDKKYVESEDISKYISNKIIEKETLTGVKYELEYNEDEINAIKFKILGILLLKSMAEINETEFANIVNYIKNEKNI